MITKFDGSVIFYGATISCVIKGKVYGINVRTILEPKDHLEGAIDEMYSTLNQNDIKNFIEKTDESRYGFNSILEAQTRL